MRDSKEKDTKPPVAPWSRVVIMLAGLVILFGLSWLFTGAMLPSKLEDSLVFQSALLMIVLGSAIIESKFTKPADSLVNSLMAILTLIPVANVSPAPAWHLVFGYCLIVLLLSVVCVSISSGPGLTGWKETARRITYKPSVLLGRARLLYSVVFLFAIFSFYGIQSPQAVLLICFWGVFLAIWPLGLPELLSAFIKFHEVASPLGRVIRTDDPDIIRVSLAPDVVWRHDRIYAYQQSDGTQKYVLPLYSQLQEQALLGTGLCFGNVEPPLTGTHAGCVYRTLDGNGLPEVDIAARIGGGDNSRLLGFIVEDSSVAQIRFETWQAGVAREGMLAWCRVGEAKVYYQITGGRTREESLDTDIHGYQTASAIQLGILDAKKGFETFGWLPPMNAPVFYEGPEFGQEMNIGEDTDFSYGNIPMSGIPVKGPFCKEMEHHTAILGITGSGKTELAFDLIRDAVKKKIKVLCIDLTARYEGRLTDLNPTNLSLAADKTADLNDKLFAVETGTYGAPNEKKVLKECADSMRTDISARLKTFLESSGDGARLGIITLQEISNTKATIFITEIYLTALLHYARANPECPRILLVVEEAHTVMPEASTMGLGDFDSKGMIGKIVQIALQGRKYGIGLLVIAQRTATVSKSVLTQCNTIISFACYDDTSLSFLSNIFGEEHIKLIPNLPPLHAVMCGKGIRSARPIVVQIPFDKAKVTQNS